MNEPTFQITLSCNGVPEKEGRVGAVDIVEEFSHRPWHHNVMCEWEGGRLVLRAENDFDSDGRALLDEFSDAVCACIAVGFEIEINVVSVVRSGEKKDR